MKTHILFAAILFVSTLTPALAQNQEPTPHIEVTGTARMDIMPDEIYVSITIREREEGRDKIDVETQETQLKKAMQSIGISLENLKLSDSDADYVKIRWKKKEVISSKQYVLKLATAEEVSKTFEKLDELKIQDAYISKTERSDIVELRRQLRIDAIKAAKEKADYLLTAIGEETGHALEVRENINDLRYRYNNIQTYSNVMISETADEAPMPEIGFEKIRIESSMYVKFEIKQ